MNIQQENKGIALKQSKAGVPELHIHAETFAAFLNSAPKSKQGWIVLACVKRGRPTQRGTTHDIYQRSFKVDGPEEVKG